jgi:hypothetical protein
MGSKKKEEEKGDRFPPQSKVPHNSHHPPRKGNRERVLGKQGLWGTKQEVAGVFDSEGRVWNAGGDDAWT